MTHILHGRRALDGLFSPLSPSAAAAFDLGCQGPDLFYHNRRTKPGAFLYGTRLHHRSWGTYLARFRDQAKNRGWLSDTPEGAFILGQATHGILDRTAHPFIVFFAGWKIPGHPETDSLRYSHAFLERILDRLVWDARSGRHWSENTWQNSIPGPEFWSDDFYEAWGDVLYSLFPRIAERNTIGLRLRNAMADSQGFLQATAPQDRLRGARAADVGALHWFHPEDLPDWDFLNLSRQTWLDPVTGQPRSESFLDLFDDAVAQARDFLATWDSANADWEAWGGNGSLNLPAQPGETPIPRFSRPWNYALLLSRETEARQATRPSPRE